MTTKLEWQEDAIKRLNKAPFFIRGLAKRKIERAAKAQGVTVITQGFVEAVKSKEMPS